VTLIDVLYPEVPQKRVERVRRNAFMTGQAGDPSENTVGDGPARPNAPRIE
jgi:hypothetical protein